MSDKAIKDELAKLREQVAELHATRTHKTPGQERHETEIDPRKEVTQIAGEAAQNNIAAEGEDAQDAEEQVRVFVNALEEEIKSTNPMTVLVVFSLGVLIGRLLPR
ncbi:MAG: hypothetical protein ACR2PB_08675 [Desulfocapsaceae bacterium]